MLDLNPIATRAAACGGLTRACLLGVGMLTAALALPDPVGAEIRAKDRVALSLPDEKWTGDLDGMIERRKIRVLVAWNKTTFFIDKGTPRGVAYDALTAFENDLNKKLKTKHLRVHLVFIPMTRQDMFQALREGLGDIAAGNLTITKERDAIVDFTVPLLRDVREIVVTGPASPAIATVDDLSGKDILVRKSSSYYESLVELNARFKREGKPQIRLAPAPENLEDEDLLEMLNAGLIRIMIVDDHKAEFWAKVFPKIVLHPDVTVRTGGAIGWAFRENSPQLKAELDAFAERTVGRSLGAEVLRRYLKDTKYVKNATGDAERRKFEQIVEIFRKYGEQYRVDYVLAAAQGYQESRLDQKARNPSGAVGVMQVLPTTGKELKVGDITELDPNIHAGVKYIRFMIDQYYENEPMTEEDKVLFAFAAYNAGPGRVRQLRRLAKERGLDENVWFNNVERVAAEKIGRETVTYVSNIFKYYVAYKLAMEEKAERDRARSELKPAPTQ
ncbi:MAG TPA: lytic transglycosylase F [Pseudolabrys sp.]|nr:lytic transglycosylase F [Pseudolabrys sp.]